MIKKALIYIILFICPFHSDREINISNCYTIEDATHMWHFSFTVNNLEYWVKRYKVLFPGVFIRQARLESANFTSNLFRFNSNLIGLRRARKRITTAIGEKSGYAVYQHYSDCVKDYHYWQEQHKDKIAKCKTEREYIQLLKQLGYAKDTSYSGLLLKMSHKRKEKS